MNSRPLDKILAEQSSELLEAAKRGEAADLERLAAWLLESRRHVQHFLMMTMLDQELSHIDPERKWNAGTSARSPVVSIDRTITTPTVTTRNRRRFIQAAAAVAASIVVLCGAYWIHDFTTGLQKFTTAVGEQRSVELADGSIMHLNTQSHVTVAFTGRAREIRLTRGEALFKVHRDAARPFRVRTGDAIVQAVGTEFNVNSRESDTTVSVLEGRVRVTAQSASSNSSTNKNTSALLNAGEQAKLRHGAVVSRTRTPDTTNIAAWRQRRLVFSQAPLSEVVAEFNRYNRNLQFHLTDGDFSSRRYSGIFDADDPESLVELLNSESDLSLQRRGTRVVISKTQLNAEK